MGNNHYFIISHQLNQHIQLELKLKASLDRIKPIINKKVIERGSGIYDYDLLSKIFGEKVQ